MVVATYILCTAQLSLLFVWKIFFLSQYGDYNNLCIAGKHVLPKTLSSFEDHAYHSLVIDAIPRDADLRCVGWCGVQGVQGVQAALLPWPGDGRALPQLLPLTGAAHWPDPALD